MSRKKGTNRPTDYLKVEDKKGFLQLPNSTILSKEFNSLNYSSRCLYLVLLTRWNREKNKSEKEFAFSYREIEKIMTKDRKVIARAIKELEDKDFISVSRHWNGIPSTYKPNTSWLK